LLKKKIGANFKRIVEYFTKKKGTKLLKIWVWDPGSGKKPIPDPGSRFTPLFCYWFWIWDPRSANLNRVGKNPGFLY
jgi:hypothetical protein